MDIIGLGEAGCNIAECFRKYPQYSVYKIDVGADGENCYDVQQQNSPEEYEKHTPNFTSFFSELGAEVIFILGGAGHISGMSLAILEQIRNRKISVLYIRPNPKSLTGKKKLLERATFGILQQYARSGLLEDIHVVSNESVANIIGNLPVIGYYDKINDLIASTLHFINVFNRTKHVYGMVEERENVCRISTIGLLDTETSEEKLFYDLDLVREKSYFYALNKNTLLNESNMVATLEGQIEEKKKEWLTNISYRLYSTDYESNFGYCVSRTSKVQGE
jgi:hypothetical protein